MKLSKKVRNELYPRNLLKMSPVCEKKENALLLRCLCLILFTSSSAGLVQEKIPPKKAIKNGFWYGHAIPVRKLRRNFFCFLKNVVKMNFYEIVALRISYFVI